MNDDGFKNFLVIGSALALMAYASFKLYEDYNRPKSKAEQSIHKIPIGISEITIENVKRKSNESLYWENLNSKENLHNLDAIKTGPDSKIKIKLNDNSVIEVEPNSLIVLEKNSENLEINFKTGDISAKNTSKNLSIKIDNSKINANSADLRLKTDSDKNTQITVDKGKALLTDQKNKKFDLTPEQYTKLSKKGEAETKTVLILLISPDNNIEIVQNTSTMEFMFTWKSFLKSNNKQTFQISSEIDFNKNSTISKSAYQAISYSLKEGHFFWRVSYINENGVAQFSETRQLNVKKDFGINLTSPVQNAQFEFSDNKNTLDFSWITKGKESSFIFELSSQIDFAKIVKSKTTPSQKISLENIPSGEYYWRVTGLGEKNQVTTRSQIFNFKINQTLPFGPQLITPDDNTVWDKAEGINLMWGAFEGAKKYKISIQKSDTKVSVFTQAVEGKKITWDWKTPGKYDWFIEALNGNGKPISRSVVNSIDISKSAASDEIVLIEPEDREKIKIDLAKDKDQITFKWQDIKESQPNYDLWVSRTPDFKKAIQKLDLNQNFVDVKLSENGVYYWKVVTKINKKLYKSSTRQFDYKLKDFIPAPELIKPRNELKASVFGKPKIGFQWKPVERAKKYHFLLSRVTQGTTTQTKVLDLQTEETKVISERLEPGTYIWQVFSIDSNSNEGPSSDIRSFVIQLKERLEAPQIRKPEIK